MNDLRCIKLILAALMIVATSLPAVAQKDGLLDASVSRGGRLYTDWMVELDERAPKVANPIYQSETPTRADVAKSWRCVSCHGWDYKGAGHVKGVMGFAGQDPASIIKVLRDDKHAYDDFLQEQDFLDLARFISVGLVNMSDMIDDQSGKAKADGLKQRPFFETVCAMCHGAEGQSLPGVSLGKFAKQQPKLTLHSIFNGHPGALMPSLRAFEDQKLVQLLAYMQSLPEKASLVSIVRGGRLYDNWYMETERSAPVGVHPSYPRHLELEIKPKQTWLCKECHGWDYKGKDGQYASGPHFTGVKGITDKQGAPVKEIIDILKDGNHAYGAVMDMKDLLDLANFVSEGQFDMDTYIDRKSKKALGDYKAHTTFYPTLCGNCHGEQGRAIRTMKALGRVANEDPWKSLHKVMNGHPAEEMPAWRSLDEETVHDLMGYIQSLPKNKRS